MVPQIKRSAAIKNVLIHRTHADLADLYSDAMEVQVNVAQDGGTRVEGDFKGRNWTAWTDHVTTWKPFRIPLNARVAPEDNDGAMTYDLAEHAEGIGMTGWDWKARLSRWVAFDFDAMTGHSERHAGRLVDEELREVERKAQEIPWVTVRRSTSGKGLHLYVFLEPVPTANHTEHAALARSIMGMMSAHAGFDFQSKVDACGGNMWVWHRKMEGTDGLTLLKQGEILTQVPPNWRDHVAVVSGKRAQNLPQAIAGGEGAERIFNELTGQQVKIPLDDQHRRLIDWLRDHNACWNWDADHHMLITHTIWLQEAHADLQLKGPFRTLAMGTERGTDLNCFVFPMREGGWVVRRYSPGVAEAATWSRDSAGWTRCFLNRAPDLTTAARSHEGVEHKSGGFSFHFASQACDAARELGAEINLPEWATSRAAKLRAHKDGRLIIEVAHESRDNPNDMPGWNQEGKAWHRIVDVQASSVAGYESKNYDDVVRHIVTESGDDCGWLLRSDRQWRTEPLKHVKSALECTGLSPKDANLVLGSLVLKPWTLVNRPFQPEYLGDRAWNRDAAQFAFSPTEDIDRLNYPTWTRVLTHLGRGLDDAAREDPWCRANGIRTGADYLMCWVASLFQEPTLPLPYLFLYSKEQNTGKSILHEGLSLLMTRGFGRADLALVNPSGFNGELEYLVLAFVEETDLQRNQMAYNRIKDYVTSIRLPIHCKGQTPYEIPNCTHWVQVANNASYCPIFPGDTRITMIHVSPLDPADLIPKPQLLKLLEREAPDFLAAALALELPPSGDRLNVPILTTEEKRHAESSNQSVLELFLNECTHYVEGQTVRVAEFHEKFREWLEPHHQSEWTRNRVGREMPPHFPKGRRRSDAQWVWGNMSWEPRPPGAPGTKLVLRGEMLVPVSETLKISA